MAKSQEERESDLHILKIFRGRCVMNFAHKATEVHEIIPRSATTQAVSMKKNRVPLCRSCHHVLHWGGITEEKQQHLRDKAERMLLGFGVNLEDW